MLIHVNTMYLHMRRSCLGLFDGGIYMKTGNERWRRAAPSGTGRHRRRLDGRVELARKGVLSALQLLEELAVAGVRLRLARPSARA